MKLGIPIVPLLLPAVPILLAMNHHHHNQQSPTSAHIIRISQKNRLKTHKPLQINELAPQLTVDLVQKLPKIHRLITSAKCHIKIKRTSNTYSQNPPFNTNQTKLDH